MKPTISTRGSEKLKLQITNTGLLPDLPTAAVVRTSSSSSRKLINHLSDNGNSTRAREISRRWKMEKVLSVIQVISQRTDPPPQTRVQYKFSPVALLSRCLLHHKATLPRTDSQKFMKQLTEDNLWILFPNTLLLGLLAWFPCRVE